MKKIIIISNIVNEEEFVNEIVNEMPVAFGAKYEFIDMEDVILVEDGHEQEAVDWLKKNHVRCVLEDEL